MVSSQFAVADRFILPYTDIISIGLFNGIPSSIMPIYEYICSSCQHEFEELVRSMAQAMPVTCPKCDSGTVKQRLSLFAARQHDTLSFDGPTGGCGRCGDPDGPCAM